MGSNLKVSFDLTKQGNPFVFGQHAPEIVDDTLTKRSEKIENCEIQKRHSLRETIDELVGKFGNRFSTELGITLEDSRRSEV